MRSIRKLSMILTLCLVLALLPVTSAHAAESGSLWLRHLPADGGVTMALVADTGIAGGVVTITYDPSQLTFQGLTVDSDYVLAHAVNDKEAGTIKISWVGKGAESGVYILMRLQFAGDPLAVATLSGSVKNTSGDIVAITVLDFGALNTAMNRAGGLKAEDYTADSFAAVQAALAAGNAQTNVETVTQAQVDALTQALVTALDNLVVYVPEPTPPEPTEPVPTEPTPTEPTQPGSTPAKPEPTQPSSQTPAPAPKGDNSWMLIVLAVLGVAAVAVVAVILKKRGRK